MSSMDTHITQLLEHHFLGAVVNVMNESHLHAGHAGDNGSGASHYNIHITWSGFHDVPHLKRQRMVYEVLDSVLKDGPIHAISIRTSV